MATITDWATVARASIPVDALNKVYVLSNRIDFSEVNTAASDVVQALTIPAGTMVIDVMTKLITAEGGVLTAEVGDGDDPNGWDASVDLNTTVGTLTKSVEGTDARKAANATGYYYSAADTIDLTMSANAADAAVIDVFALCIDLNV